MEAQWIYNGCQKTSHLQPAGQWGRGEKRERQGERVGIEPCSVRLPVQDGGGKDERSLNTQRCTGIPARAGWIIKQPAALRWDQSARDWRLTEVLSDSGSVQICSSHSRMVGFWATPSWALQAANSKISNQFSSTMSFKGLCCWQLSSPSAR